MYIGGKLWAIVIRRIRIPDRYLLPLTPNSIQVMSVYRVLEAIQICHCQHVLYSRVLWLGLGPPLKALLFAGPQRQELCYLAAEKLATPQKFGKTATVLPFRLLLFPPSTYHTYISWFTRLLLLFLDRMLQVCSYSCIRVPRWLIYEVLLKVAE